MDMKASNELAAIPSSSLDDSKDKPTFYTVITSSKHEVQLPDEHLLQVSSCLPSLPTYSESTVAVTKHESLSNQSLEVSQTSSAANCCQINSRSSSAAKCSSVKTGPTAESDDFDDTRIWCEECQKLLDNECKKHAVRVVPDKSIPSFATLTLPASFILMVAVEGGYSVVCKKLVKTRARFGPLLGKRMDDLVAAVANTSKDHLFKVFTSKTSFYYLDTSDEQNSNWMMFIRRAKSPSEENVVAYQNKGCIYFLTTKRLMPGDELKVGFSSRYAELVGGNTYSESAGVLTAQPPKEKSVIIKDGYPCDTCDLEFTQFEELQKHECPADMDTAVNEPKRPRNRRKGKPQKLGSQPEKTTASTKSLTPTSVSTNTRTQEAKVTSTVNKEKKERKLNTKHKNFRSVQVMKCTNCDSVFNTRRRLAVHMFIHTGEYPYKCEDGQCKKSFNTKFKLDRHRLSHGARDFTCAQCGKGFSRRDNLQAHLIVHDDNREVHKCEYKDCSKRYNCISSFKVHVALHQIEGNAETTCPLCKQVYEEKEKLVKHIKLHAGSKAARPPMEKKHQCSVCEKKFYAHKDKQRHMLTHTKEKHFECHLCSLKFGRSDHLKRHLAKVHPDGEKERKGRSARTSKKADMLADLTSSELTKSIQQILAENSLNLDASTTSLILPDNSGITNSAVHFTPYSNPTNNQKQYSLQPVFDNAISCSSSTDQRVNTNSYGGSIQPDTTYTQYLKPVNTTTSWQPTVGQDSLKLTQPTMILVPEGHHPITSIDQLQKPTTTGLLDTSQMLNTDTLCGDYTGDAFKVLNNYTPILLGNDGNSNDVDFLPIVYQQGVNSVTSNNQ